MHRLAALRRKDRTAERLGVQASLEAEADTPREDFVSDLMQRLMLDLRPFVHQHERDIKAALSLHADHALRPGDSVQLIFPVDHRALLTDVRPPQCCSVGPRTAADSPFDHTLTVQHHPVPEGKRDALRRILTPWLIPNFPTAGRKLRSLCSVGSRRRSIVCSHRLRPMPTRVGKFGTAPVMTCRWVQESPDIVAAVQPKTATLARPPVRHDEESFMHADDVKARLHAALHRHPKATEDEVEVIAAVVLAIVGELTAELAVVIADLATRVEALEQA